METNWIGGQGLRSASTGAIDVIDPATEEPIGSIPSGAKADCDAAIAAATAAKAGWSSLAPSSRLSILAAADARLTARQDEIATILTRENGKPLAKALQEVAACSRVLRAYMELGVHLRSGVQGAAAGDLVFQRREARGVAACITPWNYPLLAGFEVVVSNLVAGNTVVWKPSEKTPLASRHIAEHVFADLPAGVLNMVLGDGLSAGAPLVSSPATDIVCFIGSEPTGRLIGRICGEMLKKCVLELGGNDAMIVDETVDTAAAARLAAQAAFENAGQICTSTERIYVHHAVFEAFVARLIDEAERFRAESGFAPGAMMGPLIDAQHLAKVASHVEDATRRGAETRIGGRRLNRRGFFYPATVLTNVRHDMLVMSEETFGPVAPVSAFRDFDEALDLANDSRFGLSAIVCTESAPRAIKAIESVRAGMVKINTLRGKAPGATSEPFGASGIGHGYGIELLQELTRQKSVHWRSALAAGA